jgi:FkbM family methyltransferase
MNKIVLPLIQSVKSVVRRLAPGMYAHLTFKVLARRYPEPELHLLPCLCDSRKTSLDVGAAGGLYTAHLLGLSQCCIAFEPRPRQADDLRSVLGWMKVRVSVEAVALSDRAGHAKLRILVDDPGRSTIETANLLQDDEGSAQVEIVVPMRRLDDYALDNVGFVKIDVEGHELAVLQGGSQTILQNRPSFLVEIEERHRENAVNEVANFITAFGYSGFFLHGEHVRPLSEFDQASHQDSRNIGGWKSNWEKTGTYINNFIFVPKERAEAFLASASVVVAALAGRGNR